MLRHTMNKVKNVFQRIIERADKNDFSLGMPSTDQAHRDRRMNVMSIMKGGHGFRTPKKEPRRRADGTTRGDRKRAARALAHERIHAERGIKMLVEPELQVAA